MVLNATGWTELMSGNVILASYVMFDHYLVGWTIAILFILWQAITYMKNKNLTLVWGIGLIFASLFLTASYITPYVHPMSVRVIFAILVFELGGILYTWIWK